MNKAEINMDEYLELLELKKDFDKKLEEKTKEISDNSFESFKSFNCKLSIEKHNIETENRMLKLKVDNLKWDVKELKMFNENIRNELILKNEEIDYIEKTWWYKVFF